MKNTKYIVIGVFAFATQFTFGQVKDVDDNEIFPRGFTTGIAKTLGIIDE